MISQIPDREGKKKSLTSCTNFDESRFPGSIQIPFPVKDILRFPESRTVFWSNPENTLPDPASLVLTFELA